MNRFLFIIACYAFITLSSCCPQRVASNSDVRQTDSVTVITRSETVRDTVVRIAPDSAMVKALLECDSVGRVRMSRILQYEAGERAKPPHLDITDNVLTASTEVDSMKIYLTLRDRLEQQITTISDARQTETIVEVNRPTAWQRTCCWIVALTIVCMIGLGAYKLLKFILK